MASLSAGPAAIVAHATGFIPSFPYWDLHLRPLREPAHPQILGRASKRQDPAKQRACSAACVPGCGAAMIQVGVIVGREERKFAAVVGLIDPW